jgi:class 3 adenylate cyclase
VFGAIWLIADSPLDRDHFATSLLGGTMAWLGSAVLLAVLQRTSAGWPIGVLVVVRTLAYGALIAALTVAVDAASMALGTGSGGSRDPAAFWPLVALLLASSFAINLGLQLVRLVGSRDVMRLLLGTYSTPAQERRAFLFIDMQGSTTIAESLDSRDFAALKNDCFHDLAVAVEATRGDLFKYVGDGAIVTWRTATGGGDGAAWMRCHFALRDRLQRRASHYHARYGLLPRFRSGCAGGLVTVSEIGDIKRQIDYSGDALNVAARLQGECGRLDCELLAAAELLDGVSPPPGIVAHPAGEIALRGKAQPTRVVRIDRVAAAVRG